MLLLDAYLPCSVESKHGGAQPHLEQATRKSNLDQKSRSM